MTISNYHLAYFQVWSARNHLSKSEIKCQKLKKHLEALISIFGLNELVKDAIPLFESGYYSQGHLAHLTEGINFYTKALRP